MRITKDLALLYGIMLGDGCLWRSKKEYHRNLAVVGSYYDDIPFFKKIVVPLFKKFRQKPVSMKTNINRGSVKVDFSDKNLFNKFKKIGFPVGEKGVKLRITKGFTNSKLFMRYVIQGLFSTDGSLVLAKNPNKYYPRIEFTSISKKLMSQVINFLISFGLCGSLYYKPRLNKNEKDIYKIQINGLRNLLLFHKKIGLINPKHVQKFNSFLDYSSRYDKAIEGIPNQKQKFFRINEMNGTGRI